MSYWNENVPLTPGLDGWRESLGTFFYVQALCQVLRDCPEVLA